MLGAEMNSETLSSRTCRSSRFAHEVLAPLLEDTNNCASAGNHECSCGEVMRLQIVHSVLFKESQLSTFPAQPLGYQQ